jgi:predicted amidohydrolase
MKLSIALAQAEFIVADPESNQVKADQLIKQAADVNADLILLPELWVSGYDLPNCARYAAQLGGGWFEWMASAAQDSKIALGGSLIEEHKGDHYNTFVIYDSEGSLMASYRKIHLFQMLKEEDYFLPGEELSIFEFNGWEVGLATCYDLRFPELFRAYAAAGVELMLITAEWPAKRIHHWNLLSEARAVENQFFLAAVNKVGLSQGNRLGGNSIILNPMGEYIVHGGDGEELLVAEINLEEVHKVRSWMTVLNDRKPGLYQQFFSLDE